MEKYRLIKEIGDGTCGTVFRALNIQTNEIVAVKKMKRKFLFWEECVNLREVKSLCKLKHPNIVILKEIVRENDELFFIFEHMDYNLYQIMRQRRSPFSEAEIRDFMSQVLQGLAYMHGNGYFHRDLKPENLLVTNDIIKIADFGLVREVISNPPYTDYVSTRWYRAPEVLLQSSCYTPAIDMWAIGAILAELFTLSPLFPGESETDQVYKICSILGTPDSSCWPQGMELSRAINFRHFQFPPANLAEIIPNASLEAIDLILQLCSWNPQKRLTPEQALRHPFFHVGTWVPYPIQDPFCPKINQNGAKPKLDLSLWDFDSEPDECFLGLTLAVKPSTSGLGVANHDFEHSQEDVFFCSGLQGPSNQSFYWPLMPPNYDINGNSATPSPSSYMFNSQTTQPSMAVAEPSGYAIPALQPNKSCSFGPMLTISLPFQQDHFFK